MPSVKKTSEKPKKSASVSKTPTQKTKKAIAKKSVDSVGIKFKATTKKIVPKKDNQSYSYVTKDGKRVRKVTHHRSFRLSKRQIIKTKKIPPIKVLIKDTNKIFWGNKALFIRFALLFSLLDFLFVKGLGSSFNLVDTKQSLVDIIGNSNSLESSALLFGQLISSSGVSATNSSGAYHYFLVIVIILATIWLIRQIHNNNKPSLRDSLYNGMTPIVKFIVIIFVVTLQLTPALIGGFLVGTVFNSGLAVTAFEKIVWIIFYAGLMLISLYMILSSLFAVAISTLDGVTPFVALRSSRDIVLHRRMKILARLIVLLALILIIYAVIFLPLILFVPALAEPLFIVVSTFALIYGTAYIYNLYRQLL